MKRLIPVLLIYINEIQSISASAMFYHEPSLKLLDAGGTDNADFGFAMGYQNNSQNLIVGAPTMDFEGKVFTCDLKDTTTHTSCTDYQINVAALANYKRDSRSNQGFYTGSNIVTTTDYIFTCAPLWTMEILVPPVKSAIGTCFVIQDRNNISHYKGTIDEHYLNKDFYNMDSDTTFRDLMGGAGWVNLVDEENDLLLITHSAVRHDFIYGSKTKPWEQYKTISLKTTFKNDETIMWLAEEHTELIYAVVAGKFFSDKTLYAFSFETERMFGKIAFLEYDRKNKMLSIFKDEDGTIIEHLLEVLNSMFGAALGAADLNYDGFAELLVGAPAQSDNDCLECGALYIYLGGELEEVSERKGLCRLGNRKYRSRFGSTIATNDLDGDGIPEIVVSAPYEDNGDGAVYIFAGFEINKLLKDGSKYEWTHKMVEDLKYTQRIKAISELKNLGFSLQFLSDLDNNGCQELAIGSPGSGKVLLLKCLPKVKVTMSIEMIGNKIVTEKDTNFTVKVCANIEFQKTAENVAGTLFITNQITDEATTKIKTTDFQYSIEIESKTAPTVCKDCPRDCKTCQKQCKICTKLYSDCKNIVVSLTDNEPQEYNFTTKAELKSDHIQHSAVFSTSWVVAFENSVQYLQVSRQKCEGEECLPRLTLRLDRFGSMDKIVAGESLNKTVIARVHNAGGQSFHTCVKVYIESGNKALIQGGYSDTYYLPTPFNKEQQDKIEIVVDTSTPVNIQKELQVKVELYENCDRKLGDHVDMDNVTIPYEFKTNNIVVSGSPHRLNAFNVEEGHAVKDHQEYTITNDGSVLWKNIQVLLSLKRTKFIVSFKVLEQASSTCKENDDEEFYNRTCIYDLKPYATLKITTVILINRLDTMGDEELNVTSKLLLYLEPTDTVFNKSLTTVIEFKQESLSNKKWLVALIATVVAVLILICFVLVLYKIGFFKRKQKEELAVLRTSIKRRNSRRGTHTSGQDVGNTVIYEGLEMDVEEDSPFDEIEINEITETDTSTTKDNADLIGK